MYTLTHGNNAVEFSLNLMFTGMQEIYTHSHILSISLIMNMRIRTIKIVTTSLRDNTVCYRYNNV